MHDFTVRELIRALEKLEKEHGDVPVVIYTSSPEKEYGEFTPEFNDDGGDSVVLLSV